MSVTMFTMTSMPVDKVSIMPVRGIAAMFDDLCPSRNMLDFGDRV